MFDLRESNDVHLTIVVPAKAGTQRLCIEETLDSRLRGNDEEKIVASSIFVTVDNSACVAQRSCELSVFSRRALPD